MPTFIHITANGTPLPGVPNFQTMGNDDMTGWTQVLSYYHEVTLQQSGNLAAGSRMLAPFTFVKAVDRISPLLLTAIGQNQSVAANVRIYGVHPVENFPVLSHQYVMLNGRVTGLRREMQFETQIQPGSTPLERVSIYFTEIRETAVLDGFESVLDIGSQNP